MGPKGLRRMCYFYKLIKTQKTFCLFNLIPPKRNSLRHPNTYSALRCRNECFKTFRNSTSCQQFKKMILSFIKPICSSLFSVYLPVGLKLLARLRLGFSHLCEHKFRHNFHDTLNPLCSCSLKP